MSELDAIQPSDEPGHDPAYPVFTDGRVLDAYRSLLSGDPLSGDLLDSDALDDDDYVFEPDPWDFAVTIGLRPDPETDPEALDELVDAMLVGARGPELERLTDAAIERLWDEELESAVREGIVGTSCLANWEEGARTALAEFDRAPRESEVSREVIRFFAMQLGQNDHPLFFCLDCLGEAISGADSGAARRALARRVAILARRNVAVPERELRAALAGVGSSSPAAQLGTGERRAAVRARLGRLGALGRDSMPTLAAELRAIAAEPLPRRAEDDDVWAEVCTLLLTDAARPELN